MCAHCRVAIRGPSGAHTEIMSAIRRRWRNQALVADAPEPRREHHLFDIARTLALMAAAVAALPVDFKRSKSRQSMPESSVTSGRVSPPPARARSRAASQQHRRHFAETNCHVTIAMASPPSAARAQAISVIRKAQKRQHSTPLGIARPARPSSIDGSVARMQPSA